MSPRSAVVVLGAGSGRRVGAEVNKILLPLAGEPVLAHSVRTALAVEDVVRVVVVVRPEDRDDVTAALTPLPEDRELWLVDGGDERHDSEDRALQALRADIEAGTVEVVAIHDAARPLATADLFATVLQVAGERGGAVPAVAVTGLSDRDGGPVGAGLAAVQTPQAFRALPLLAAYDAARADGFTGTDTAACLERYAEVDVVAVPGAATNLKVTYPGDLGLAEELLSALPPG